MASTANTAGSHSRRAMVAAKLATLAHGQRADLIGDTSIEVCALPKSVPLIRSRISAGMALARAMR